MSNKTKYTLEQIQELLKEAGFRKGRMISGSKSYYYKEHPTHDVVFNANICLERLGKVWYGDLDITLDEEGLKDIAKVIGEPLYVLRESDARFEKEGVAGQEVIKYAYHIIKPT